MRGGEGAAGGGGMAAGGGERATDGREPAASGELACDACLRRTHLLTLLSPFIDQVRDRYGRPDELLALGDEELLAGLAGSRRPEIERALERFRPGRMREAVVTSGQLARCLHDADYPERLRHLAGPPAVLFSIGPSGEMGGGPAAAVVGARRASEYGVEVARTLGRGLSAAGVTVVSGMAMGVDAAAHEGALAGGGATVAVLGCGADVAYPASRRRLHARLRREAAVVSELPPGFTARRWCFPVRNRIIAALAEVVVVVEGGERSGSLITARLARELAREVGAVPGRVTSPASAGPNALLFDGAHPVRGAQDVLDLLFGAGVRAAPPAREPGALEPDLRAVYAALARGEDTLHALTRAGHDLTEATAALAELELRGFVSRGAGGVYVVTP